MTTETKTTKVSPSAVDIAAAPSFMTRLVMSLITVVILLLDQLTKFLVRTQITLHDSIEIVPGFLNFVHVHNTGAAFGFLNTANLANKQLLMTTIALIALVAIGFYASQVGSRETLPRASLALIFGGALGNLIDRASTGYVIDFVDVYWWNYHFWAFNVADSAISIGACLLILDILLTNGTDVSTPV
jgi:signal peptidase II